MTETDARRNVPGLLAEAGMDELEAMLAGAFLDALLEVRAVVRRRRAAEPRADPVVLTLVLGAEFEATLASLGLPMHALDELAVKGRQVIAQELGFTPVSSAPAAKRRPAARGRGPAGGGASGGRRT